MLYGLAILLKGLKPSLAIPSLTLRASCANQLCSSSNLFQDSESAGCLIVASSVGRCSLCHLISHAICADMKRRCNLGFKGKCRNTFLGIRRALCVLGIHLEALQIGHSSRSAFSFQNKMQSLGHA
ncbi:hypothetical protein CIPAW_14G082900 [Carya illinoinensis]|uniref:Secreted protein n=1 Tax=Carya illinoinensis TaxID=32201 RepID=A0A8T1NKJ7_CARIL|nr:hypothetical protein CIPAW_14G082900 [Carya illinoinensis]